MRDVRTLPFSIMTFLRLQREGEVGILVFYSFQKLEKKQN